MFENKKSYIFFYFIILLFTLLPCFFVTLTNSSLLDDASNYVLNALSHFSNGDMYIQNSFDHRARMSVLFLTFIPLNIAYFIFKITSLKWLVHIYACTLFLLPVLLCFFSVFLFFKAKKDYLSIFPILLLSIGIFPVFPYGCVENYTAVFVLLIFFQYFYLNFKLKIYDYLIFILISLSLYNLHECIVLISPIIWYTYFKISDKNNKILLFGFINSLLAFILYFIFAYTPIGPEILSDYAVVSSIYFLYWGILVQGYKGSLINFNLFYYLLISANIIALFRYTNLKRLSIIAISSFIIFLILIPFFDFYLFKLYRFTSIYMLMIFTIFLILKNKDDTLLKKISKNSIPLVILSFIISNIYIYLYSYQYQQFNKELVKASNHKVFYFEDKINDFDKLPIFRGNMIVNNNHISQIAYSIIAINSEKNNNITNGIIIGMKENKIIPNYCNNTLYVNGGALKIEMETKFWNISQFKPYFYENCD